MLQKILIANRGEIACRIIRTCQKKGIKTVAVYSDADSNSMHRSLADEAVYIGGSRSAESYLNTQNILKAATDTGAEGIHPGYGFLAESPEFASNVVKEGLVWLGPSANAIRLMGDKQKARESALEAGVPVLPGTGIIKTKDATTIAERVGYPLLVKAAAGGGGIGMRLVNKKEELNNIIKETQSQANSAFGSDNIYLEKYISNARHIEIQIFGFGTHAIHMYERDCSIQRRFQKIIEETGAPNLKEEVKKEMYKAAIALAEHVHYTGLGTVEFILDADTNKFYFLEMNTRIQVEHPITEKITGLDLVGLQIDYASNNMSSFSQRKITRSGHSIECRIYAEDPSRNFFPSPGTLERFELPKEQNGVRIDTGYRENDVITPFYDPLLAKVITHSTDRVLAINAMKKALKDIKIDGIKTNLAFLLSSLEHFDFQNGTYDTNFIRKNQQELINT